MKMLGVIFIFAAAVSAAAVSIRHETRKLMQLDQCCTALKIITAEVDRLSTTDTIMRRLKECKRLISFSTALERNCALSFEQRWINACKTSFTDIENYDLSEICSLGGFLGRYERTQELEALMSASRHFDDAAINERQNSLQKRRTSLGLYAAVGVLIITVLL